MSSDRGAAALAERLSLTLPIKKGRLPWMSDTVADLLASGQFERAAAVILGERGVFLPDGLPPFVEQMAAEIERLHSEPAQASARSCGCTCCSGHWETVSITLRCSGGCGCIASTDLAQEAE